MACFHLLIEPGKKKKEQEEEGEKEDEREKRRGVFWMIEACAWHMSAQTVKLH